MGIGKTEEKLVRWNVQVEMLSVADCIPQFLYLKKKKETLMLKLICVRKMSRGMVHRLLKEMGVGRKANGWWSSFYLFQSNCCVKFIYFLVPGKIIILRLFTKMIERGKRRYFRSPFYISRLLTLFQLPEAMLSVWKQGRSKKLDRDT